MAYNKFRLKYRKRGGGYDFFEVTEVTKIASENGDGPRYYIAFQTSLDMDIIQMGQVARIKHHTAKMLKIKKKKFKILVGGNYINVIPRK